MHYNCAYAQHLEEFQEVLLHMIFYFTGSGNSFDVARTIAATTGDEMVDLGAAWKTDRFGLRFHVSQGEDLGFVFPVQAWSTPPIVDDFLREAEFITDNGRPYVPGYSYCVITCGNFVGNTAEFFRKMLRTHHGINLDASYSVKSVGNCVYLYDMPNPARQEQMVRTERRTAKQVAAAIDAMQMGSFEERNPFGSFMSHFTGRQNKTRSVAKFHVDTQACISCGTCQKICPTNTVRLQGGHPTWSGDGCTQCLACLHRCPQQATQYGSHTAKRGRYINPVLKSGRQLTENYPDSPAGTTSDISIPFL